MTEELAMDLLAVTDKYLLDDLKVLCEKFLSENISLENLVKLANLTENQELPVLRKAITRFVPKNIKEILEDKSLYQLTHNCYFDIIDAMAVFLSFNSRFYRK